MRSKSIFAKLMYTMLFALAACSQTTPKTTLPAPQISAAIPATMVPTYTSIPTDTPALPQVSFESATYRDKSAGFELDYPAAWTADSPQIGGDRGAISCAQRQRGS